MKKKKANVFLCFFLGISVFPVPWLQEDLAATPSPERSTPLVRAVKRVMPAVVNIGTEQYVRVADPFESYFNEFFGVRRYSKKAMPLGSGVIVDATGLVLTNNHVVQRASNLRIRLWDGETCSAVPIATDPTNDLALLQLDTKALKGPLNAIGFATPDDLILGETVAAVGNPFGLEHSVSAGVLSARNRTLQEGDAVFTDILQTDAAINPGNSGGPLVNLDGDLIGINIAIRQGAQGIGFAIPMHRIEDVLARWLVPGRFSLGCCGLVAGTKVEDGQMHAVVAALDPGSPAAGSELKKGDRILRVQGTPVHRAIDVGRILWPLKAGDEVRIDCENGKTVTLTLCRLSPRLLVRRRLGIQVQELTKPLRRALGLPDDLRGLTVSDVQKDSELGTCGVRRGDIILRVGTTDTATLDDAFTALKDVRPGQILPVFLIAIEQNRGQLFGRRFAVNVTIR